MEVVFVCTNEECQSEFHINELDRQFDSESSWTQCTYYIGKCTECGHKDFEILFVDKSSLKLEVIQQ